MEDRELNCVDCGKVFTFTKGEQDYYKDKGYNTPKRCAECRPKKRATFQQREQQQ